MAVRPATAQAQTPHHLVLGLSPVLSIATALVAQEDGLFRQRKLSVQTRIVAVNKLVPAMLVEGKLDVATVSPTVLLHAVEAGSDLVVLGGADATSRQYVGAAFVVPMESTLHSAADCMGRRIAVPSLGAFLHVAFMAWLKANRADSAKVTFVEVPLHLQEAHLQADQVDGAVSGQPLLGRLLAQGQMRVVAYPVAALPEGYPTLMYVTTRTWATQNADVAREFRAALEQASAVVQNPRESSRVRELLARQLKLRAGLVSEFPLPTPLPVITVQHLAYWANQMKEFGLLSAMPNLSRLVF